MSDNIPLVSLVTPSFNQGPFLRRTIESVLGQTYPNLEYFVIDGSSTDESVDTLRSYGDRLQWVSEPDRGQTHAINKGFAQARGSILGFLCSDDLLERDAVEKAVGYFMRHPDWDMLYGRAYFIDERDQVLGLYETEPYSYERLARACYICQPAAFWRTEAAQRIGPLNERFNHSMDYEYWLRMARAGCRIEYVPDILAASRVHDGSRTFSEREHVFRADIAITSELLGHADISYFRGLWHYRTRVKPTGWPRHFRQVPKFIGAMSCLHYGLHHAALLASRAARRRRRGACG
jgi:glycosyltransferase involved in cell wall biosynthesis